MEQAWLTVTNWPSSVVSTGNKLTRVGRGSQALQKNHPHCCRAVDHTETVGRQLHQRERGNGNVALMAQLMAGAQHDPVLARATQYAMAAWTSEIAAVLGRVLTGSPVADLIDIDGLAHVISAGFIGIELYDGVNTAGASRALSTLEDLGQLLEVVNDLGRWTRRHAGIPRQDPHHQTTPCTLLGDPAGRGVVGVVVGPLAHARECGG